ncbi:SDR family oxidoreductase [Cellulomonas sp. SG140]|uniref:SDR family oxidoreductase n=1 Tax=Cellulomonas sp. SG140 TaxID=2976536 RepID=UPI0021E8879D|nr:SDR family oxidoreductase [Cellulomonas sp. SG140]
MSLTDHRVLVIGGSSGMGLATARAAAQAGAAVTITSTAAGHLDVALAALPDGCAGEVLDLRDEDALAHLFDHVGELHHLVITAGDAVRPSPLAGTPLHELRPLLDVRFWGAVAAVQHALPHLAAGASITLTSGTIAERPAPGSGVMAAGAAAIEGLTRGLAVELAPVRVNAVRPGVVRTPMWDAVPEQQRTAVFEALASRTLVGAVGTAEQIAAAHVYLMENDFVTGTVLTLDGGALLA